MQYHPGEGGLDSAARQRFAELIRARHPAICVQTVEEDYATALVVGAAVELGKEVLRWSVVQGIKEGLFEEEHPVSSRDTERNLLEEFGKSIRRVKPGAQDTEHPAGALRNFVLTSTPRIFLLFDLVPHLDDEATLRCLREAIAHAQRTDSQVVLIDHGGQPPPVIEAMAVRYDIHPPNEDEVAAIVRDTLRHLRDEDHVRIEIDRQDLAAMVRNLCGLTRRQVRQLILEVGLVDGRFHAGDLERIIKRKRSLLQSGGILQQVEQVVSIDEVGGYDNLKQWLRLRRAAQGEAGRRYGLERPRGMLLLGVPGSGKSFCAKAVAAAWQRPLVRLDAGALYDRFVGESESRLRSALTQAEAMAPVILWIDEIEKAFASAAGRSTDGGLSQRMFGSLLTWMQEHTAAVFIVATANDIEALPPELLRKGRFDEIFFVDLPNESVRRRILEIHLAKRKRDPAAFDCRSLARLSDGYSGSELEECLRAAIFKSFGGESELTTAGIEEAIRETRPLSVTMAERIRDLRRWAQDRCVMA